MQVETLRDILKSLRFFPYAENRLAQTDIFNADPITYYSKNVRIYLNEHELFLPIAGSGTIMFGNMEMDFIDHVEIYEGFPSFDFGVEPATIVIRLYSKTAEHDMGGRVKASIGTYGANKQNAYYADIVDDYSYFVYANRLDDKQDTYEHDSQTLRRDKLSKRFYGSVNSKNHQFELHAQQTDGDGFLGSLVGNTPSSTSVKSNFINISTNSKFLEDTLSFKMSYINSESDFDSKYDLSSPVYLPYDNSAGFIPVTSLEQTIKEEAFTAMIKKDWHIDSHDISAGIQYRYKNFDLTDIKFNTPTSEIEQAYYTENIYSFFIQDLISLSENHMITLSLMDQVYEREGDVKDPNTVQLRLAYIYSDSEWVGKTFISYQEFASEPYMTISPHYGNEELVPEAYYSISQEFSYKKNNTLSKLFFDYGLSKKIPYLTSDFIMQNSSKDIYGIFAALEFTLFFRDKDKLELQVNYSYLDSVYSDDSNSHFNYTIRVLNTISSFDIFNELVIRESYIDIDRGYDYSAGIKYAITKDFHLNLKGENIFNSGAKWRYIDKFSLTADGKTDTIEVPIIERRFWFGMEYLF
jgi:iron complex outermembrane receptor protein